MMSRLRFSTPKSEIFLGGFTLIELVTVIVLISILVSLGVPVYNRAIERARDNEARTNLRLIQAAQKIFQVENRMYFPGNRCASCNNCILNDINSDLKLNLNDNFWVYCVSTNDSGGSYLAQAARLAGGFNRIYQVDQDDVAPICTGVCP